MREGWEGNVDLSLLRPLGVCLDSEHFLIDSMTACQSSRFVRNGFYSERLTWRLYLSAQTKSGNGELDGYEPENKSRHLATRSVTVCFRTRLRTQRMILERAYKFFNISIFI